MNKHLSPQRLLQVAVIAIILSACSQAAGTLDPAPASPSAAPMTSPPAESPQPSEPTPSTPVPTPPGTVGEIECTGSATTGDLDYGENPAGGPADLEAATRGLRGVLPSDEIAVDGDRSGVIRAGRVVATGSWFKSTTDGWLLSSLSACGDAGISAWRPSGLVRDAMAEVLVDGLRVRSLPTTADESAKFETLLDRDDQVFIVDGPVPADGYEWYLVQGLIEGSESGPFGWVAAASRDGEQWIDDVGASACPTLPDDAVRLGVLAPELLVHCFGGTELEFDLDAHVYCLADEVRQVDPAWFGAGCGLLSGDACGTCGLSIAADPASGVELPTSASQNWRITGHVDDPAAASCSGGPPAGDSLVPEYVVHLCRMTFVVTSLTPQPID
jgi:hypothetical protein